MPEWGLAGLTRLASVGVNTSGATGGTALTTGASFSKGSWVELLAATAFSTVGLSVYGVAAGVNNVDCLFDIGIGAADSEQVIIPNLGFHQSNGTTTPCWFFPLSIPAGSRLAARAQAGSASTQVFVQCQLGGGSFTAFPPLSLVTAYGVNLADSGGTSVDPGGSANTKGAYSQLTASTTYPIRALTWYFPNQGNGARTAADWLVDFAIGAAGSEQVIVPNVSIRTFANVLVPGIQTLPVGPIPAGTRLAVRAQCNTADPTDRLIDCILYGVS